MLQRRHSIAAPIVSRPESRGKALAAAQGRLAGQARGASRRAAKQERRCSDSSRRVPAP